MHIALSITEGRTVRDLFCNGLLDRFTEAGATVAVFTEAVNVKPFIDEWSSPGVSFHMLHPCTSTSSRSRAWRVRKSIAKLNCRPLLNLYRAWEDRRFYSPRTEYIDEFRKQRPDVYLSTHSQLTSEAELLHAARKLDVPTVGMIRSWDNVLKGVRCHPDRMTVWNEINLQELVSHDRYSRSETVITGAPQFDCYFQEDVLWDRDRFFREFNLDPERPYILFASNGYFIPGFDETCWLEALLTAIDAGTIPNRPQVICRLHPWSRLEHFQKFADHPDVRMSYVDKYIPALTWYMDRADMGVMANLLHHADVIITPGSTVVLESAIFDRPCLAPVFHPYQPERAADIYREYTLSKHFARILEHDLVPVITDPSEYTPVINRFLEDPAWYREGRALLVKDYVSFTDGESTRRLANVVLESAGMN